MQIVEHQNKKIPQELVPFVRHNTIVSSSPGRINLIGEHTDYNEGFVLPASINKRAFIALTPRADDKIILNAINKQEQYETTIHQIQKIKNGWQNYLLGVVAMFQKKGVPLLGFDLAMISDVPIGAGLSSSAALECAMAGALNHYFKTNFSKIELTQMAQQAEHEYAGVLCGIMDQFASVFGKQHHVIRLDCRSLEYIYKPFDIAGYKIILLDTSIKHNLASSEYNVRRQQCEQGVAWIKAIYPEVNSLRDVTMDMLEKHVFNKDQLIYNRCKYVVQENERLLAACNYLDQKDMVNFGKKMFETHEGLSQLYAVSCKELDYLVQQAKTHSAIVGARMMGGGFGGCTINIIQEDKAQETTQLLVNAYEKQTHLQLKVYEVSIEDGLQIL